MPAATLSIKISAPSEDIFDLTHNYARRLEWDAFLREARLLYGATAADVGVSSRCVARWGAGGAAMETRYVTYQRPDVAAVAMTRGPWFLKMFAASIRHEQIDDNVVKVSYRYTFKPRPGWLAFAIEPIVQFLLRRETTRRLTSLKSFIEQQPG